MTIRLTEEVLAAISAAQFSGANMKLTEQLDRQLYGKVAKVIEAAGGKWNRKAAAHVFADGDAFGAMDPVMLTGEVTNKKQELGQFETPSAVVDLMCEHADLCRGLVCMEPNAGKSGNLVLPMLEALPKKLTCYELDKPSCDQLNAKVRRLTSTIGRDHVEVHCADFLQVIPFQGCDLVMMNPPFAKQADIAHVLHADCFLKPGVGRCVAIMSAGIRFRRDGKTRTFRDWLGARGGSIYDLPADSFKSSGTSVNTVMVTFEAAR